MKQIQPVATVAAVSSEVAVDDEFTTAQSLPLATHHDEQHGAAAAADVGAVGGEVAGIAVASNAAQYEVTSLSCCFSIITQNLLAY